MKNILFLSLPFEEYYYVSQFQQISKSFDFEINLIQLIEGDSIQDAKSKIEKSNLIIIQLPHIIQYYGDEIQDILLDWVKDGGSAMVFINPNIDQIQNRFLSSFGMTNTGFRLRPEFGYDVDFIRSAHSYRDRMLFKGVEIVTITQPNRIYCHGESEPILYNDDYGYKAIDGFTDFEANVDSKEIAPVVFWENSKNKSRFMAISGTIKLEKNDNLLFFKNIIEYLLDKPELNQIAHKLFSSIEIELLQFVDSVLMEKHGNNWKVILPDKIKDQLLKNTASTENFKTGLFFINLKTIIKTNWDIFHPHFSEGGKDSKSKALNWMDRTNEIRKYIAHPMKGLEEGNLITRESIDFLSENLESIKELNSLSK